MKNIRIVALTLIVISLIACKKEAKKDSPKTIETVETVVIETISQDELKSLDNNIQLVDVRTPEEYEAGYIKNAMNINIKDKAFLESTVLLDKTKPVYVYCMMGGRSTSAAKALEEAGFTKVYNYKGGFKEWAKNGNTISMD